MRKLIFYISIIFIFSLSQSLATNKIAYIDIDLILSTSIPSKSLFVQLKKIEDLEIEKLKKKEELFKLEENKILSTKNIVSKEEFNKNVELFKLKIDNYTKLKSKTLQDLKKRRNNEVLLFLKKINPLIEQIMELNSVEIIIEKKNIFIAKSNYDITQKIIESINKNIKEYIIEK